MYPRSYFRGYDTAFGWSGKKDGYLQICEKGFEKENGEMAIALILPFISVFKKFMFYQIFRWLSIKYRVFLKIRFKLSNYIANVI
jgi:hypothetical protein